MARTHRRLIAALTLGAAVAAGPAFGSSLRALHVVALGMRADRTRVQVGEIFHLAIHVRVRENVGALDELVIPDVGTMQLLGDERQTTHGVFGTDVVETLTLQPLVTGRYTFAPAYLDAVDARSGKPMRFFARRPVTVVVAGGAVVDAEGGGFLRRGIEILAAVLLFAVVLALLALGIVRRRRERPVVTAAPCAVPSPPPPPAPPSARERVMAALRTYRVTPGGAALLRLRAELFAAAGAGPGGTLRDALAGTNDAALRGALSAAEAAAFGPERERDAAGAELVRATETWLR